MNSDILFYILCAILIGGIAYTYITFRKGRGDEYVYVSRKDKKHYFADYNSAKSVGGGIRMIKKDIARNRGLILYRGDRK